MLAITVDRETTGYVVVPIAHDDPAVRAFRVVKVATQENYDIAIGPTGAVCECLGHLRWGHKTPCKHVAALRVLITRGAV